MKFEGKNFANQTVQINGGDVYFQCRFENCALVWDKDPSKAILLEGCDFQNCTFNGKTFWEHIKGRIVASYGEDAEPYQEQSENEIWADFVYIDGE